MQGWPTIVGQNGFETPPRVAQPNCLDNIFLVNPEKSQKIILSLFRWVKNYVFRIFLKKKRMMEVWAKKTKLRGASVQLAA